MKSSKPHLALFLPNLDGGGAERMMVNLAKGFIDRKIDVDFILAERRGPYLEKMPNGVRIVDLASGSVTRSLPKLVSYLRDRRPEVLLTSLQHASIVALWARLVARVNTRVFIREANTPSQSRGKRPKQRIVSIMMRHFYPWADGIIAVSQGVAKDIHHFVGIPCDKIATIYNPVVTADLKEMAREEVSHSWFAPASPPVILGVGRLTKQKDFSTLIRAFSQVRRVKEAKLMILGEGEERLSLETLINGLDLESEVILFGFDNNPFSKMARAGLFVLSSRWEGLPGVLIQAMACGCPVVSTDCPSGPREILQDGIYGPLVEVGNSDMLAKAMLATLQHPPPREALQFGALPFLSESIIESYASLLFPSLPKTTTK